ncbi:MAG: EAL domain-containing protein, partial [Ruthenibacterium sp.]
MKSENRTDTKNTRGERLLECLRESVRQDFAGFSLCYQPLMSAQNGALRGCEALLRWCHPDFPQAVSPCEFVPILEESGLILEVGSWVLDSAVRQCAVWGKQQPNFQM